MSKNDVIKVSAEGGTPAHHLLENALAALPTLLEPISISLQ